MISLQYAIKILDLTAEVMHFRSQEAFDRAKIADGFLDLVACVEESRRWQRISTAATGGCVRLIRRANRRD
jgi:hypothetical protein